MYSKMTCISSFLKWDKDSLYHNIGRSWVLYSIANSLAKVLKCLCLEQQQCIQFAKSFQSCPTLCDPIDGSQPGSPVPGILQARTLEWVAVSFSNAWKWKVKVKSLSRVWLFATPWTAAYQAPPSMRFSRQEYWSGVPSPSPWLCSIMHHKHHPTEPQYSHLLKWKWCSCMSKGHVNYLMNDYMKHWTQTST